MGRERADQATHSWRGCCPPLRKKMKKRTKVFPLVCLHSSLISPSQFPRSSKTLSVAMQREHLSEFPSPPPLTCSRERHTSRPSCDILNLCFSPSFLIASVGKDDRYWLEHLSSLSRLFFLSFVSSCHELALLLVESNKAPNILENKCCGIFAGHRAEHGEGGIR